MKIKFSIIALSFFVTANAQVKTAAINARSAAQQMFQFFIAKNYLAYSKCIHPTITNMMGGEAKMAEVVKNAVQQTEKNGLIAVQIKIGEPSKIVSTNNELETIIPETTKFKTAKGFYNDTSYLLAISTDNGKTWRFVDTNGRTWAQVKAVFPNLSNQLVMPVKGKPVFSKN